MSDPNRRGFQFIIRVKYDNLKKLNEMISLLMLPIQLLSIKNALEFSPISPNHSILINETRKTV